MTVFVKRGSDYFPTPREELNFEDVLPPGNFVLKITPLNEWYFEPIDPFEFKGKIYGSSQTHTERMYNTYLKRTNSTGVMLAGEKGCGKSLQAKMLANKFISEGHPCIIINEPYHGDHFNKLMQDIKQPCVVLFDEFEKVYNNSNQQAILTLLDGVFPTKKMFVLTCNDKYRIDSHLRNRPGRIYYMIDYAGLEVEFIREYCQDNLNEKKYIDTICSIATTFNSFNFDMLKAIVEEMNRYNEPPLEVVKLLNVRPHVDELAVYDIEIVVNGVEVYYQDQDTNQGAPFSGGNPTFKVCVTEDDYDKDNNMYITVEPQDLLKMNAVDGTYVFECKEESLGLSAIITYHRRKNAPYTPFGGLGSDL